MFQDVIQDVIDMNDNTAYLIEKLDAEENNLALHVQLCEQRYHQLLSKFDHVDERFEKLEQHIIDIKDSLKSNDAVKYKMYLSWAGAAITALIAVVVALIKLHQ